MGSRNIDNRSEPLVFKRFNRLLYKYYPKFVRAFKKHCNKFDIRQFLAVLYDRVPSMENFCSIDRRLKNVNVLQVETDKNLCTVLYSDTKKLKLLNKKI